MVTSLSFLSFRLCAATTFNPLTSEIRRKRSSRSAPLKSNDIRLLPRGTFVGATVVGGTCSCGDGDGGGISASFDTSFDGTRLGSDLGRLAGTPGGGFRGVGGCALGASSPFGASAT